MALLVTHVFFFAGLICLGATLKCTSDSKGLKVHFDRVKGANYYEVQVGSSEHGEPFAAQSTEAKGGGYVHIYGALEGHTYYVRLRTHSSSHAMKLLHGWSKPGSWFKCYYSGTSRRRRSQGFFETEEDHEDAGNLT